MRRFTRIAAIALLALPGVGAAEDDPAAPQVDEKPAHWSPLGSRTRAWLERQRSGADASPVAPGLTPPADRRARMRYLQSFEHPIPALFQLDETEGR